VVPGLTNSSFRSFESVNYPGYYLRRGGSEIVLEKRFVGRELIIPDGFDRDATFQLYESERYDDAHLLFVGSRMIFIDDPIGSPWEVAPLGFREYMTLEYNAAFRMRRGFWPPFANTNWPGR
jgi:hypothetical protein